jgi:phosphopantetheinyl transferase (holo-ACP synthase)
LNVKDGYFMLAVGIDLIEVARVEESLGKYGRRFLDRIYTQRNGRPTLLLHGAAQDLARKQNLDAWSISLSHTETHAISAAVAMKMLMIK